MVFLALADFLFVEWTDDSLQYKCGRERIDLAGRTDHLLRQRGDSIFFDCARWGKCGSE